MTAHQMFGVRRIAGAFVLAVGSAAVAAAGQTPAPAAPPAEPSPTLELSMAKAVEMALDANLGLAADRMNLESASDGVAAARASFLPQLVSGLSRQSSRSVPNDFTQGVVDITSENVVVSGGLSQVLPWMGTRYSASWNNTRNAQVGGNPLFNPFLSSQFAVTVTQPLWRGLRIDAARASLETSQRRRAIADVELQQQAVRLTAEVQNAYLDLLSATQALRVAEENMAIRQGSLTNARARVAVGAAAPIEVISAEADVASNQEQVLVAQADIQTREDALRTLVLDPSRPDFWTVRVLATDPIQSNQRPIDLDGAVRNALENRLDLIVARRNLDIQRLSLEAGRDATRPAVDLRVDYSTRGTGGTRFTYGQGFPPEVVDRQVRAFGSVLGDTFGAAYPTWSAGISIAYPLGRSAAEASHAQQTVARRQSEIALRQLEIAVVQQIREAARRAESSYQRVLVTRAALRASEQQFEVEQRRFASGLSTTLELQVRQGQLASARTAELNALIGYSRALIEFERVQQTQ